VSEPARSTTKTAVVVAAKLRRRILTGDLATGTSLTESDLLDEFGISRPTLREALRMLEVEQLLTVRRGSHRGSVVRMPDTSVTVRSLTMLLYMRGATMRDIYAARSVFEPPAARLAAEVATDEQIDRLRHTLEEELSALAGPAVAYPTIGWRFHTELVELSGNATLAVMAAALEHISQQHAENVVAHWSQDQEKLVERATKAHRKLVDMIAKREGAAAERFWSKHMQIAGELLFADADNSLIQILD
jgi:GntR family transcriptional regulator, transcriptional repressor for pyruvate dehydrogenase complex